MFSAPRVRSLQPIARITAFVKDGVVAGVVLINAKAYMMKAKNAIGKEYTEALFE